jgi:hypothetical protein
MEFGIAASDPSATRAPAATKSGLSSKPSYAVAAFSAAALSTAPSVFGSAARTTTVRSLRWAPPPGGVAGQRPYFVWKAFRIKGSSLTRMESSTKNSAVGC